MKVTRFLLSAVLLVGFAGVSFAQVTPIPEAGGNLQIQWDTCVLPVVQNKNSTAGPNTIYATVSGHSLPHQAYAIWLLVGDSNRQLPDAWRFDSQGCAGGLYSFVQQPPAALSKLCPGFVPAATPQVTIPAYQFAPAGLGYATTLGNPSLSVAYSNGGLGSPNINPALRYHLAGFTFDHTFSTPGPTPGDLSTCGGFERGMCIVAIPNKCSWVDLAGIEWEFNGVPAAFLTYNGGTAGGLCPGVIPAEQKSWGSIKSQYKR
jgi:hypothetical protein